ncbi:hypothetical protein U9M48_006308 [Paspalum notatum var. saurae]|uniref:Uncharacterized protein n=1 Tax=Paspalum notatum var. saurae TaxID=547442 RepID=A0AAQ3PNR3_PASNO
MRWDLKLERKSKRSIVKRNLHGKGSQRANTEEAGQRRRGHGPWVTAWRRRAVDEMIRAATTAEPGSGRHGDAAGRAGEARALGRRRLPAEVALRRRVPASDRRACLPKRRTAVALHMAARQDSEERGREVEYE